MNTFKNLRNLFLGLGLLLQFSNAQAYISPFIMGGQEVPAGHPVESTTVLIIGKIARATFTCTGIVYSSQLILTAGHCLGGPGYAELVVHFGRNQKVSAPRIKVVQQIRVADIPVNSPPYDWGDIALLKLATPIPSSYKPASIAMYPLEILDGHPVLMVGYGRTVASPDYNGDSGAGILRMVTQRILQYNYGETEILADISQGRGSCTGDSGGPLFIEQDGAFQVVGLTSRMTIKNKIPDSKPEKYACTTDMVYTKISAHRDWIESTAQQMMNSKP